MGNPENMHREILYRLSRYFKAYLYMHVKTINEKVSMNLKKNKEM